jgi:hypothetical protein
VVVEALKLTVGQLLLVVLVAVVVSTGMKQAVLEILQVHHRHKEITVETQQPIQALVVVVAGQVV